MNPVVLLIVAVLVAIVVIKLIKARPSMPATAAYQAVQQNTAILIDVREPDEWVDGVAAPAVLLPLSDLRHGRKQWGPFLDQHRGRKLLLYCQSGMRSGAAATALRREGFDAINVGGLAAWTGAGLPTRKPNAA